MADWSIEDVAARFAEAADTGRRLPRVRVQGYFNVWPELGTGRLGSVPRGDTRLPSVAAQPARHRADAGDDALGAVAGGRAAPPRLDAGSALGVEGHRSPVRRLHTDLPASLAAGDPDRGRSPQPGEGHGVVRGPSISEGVCGLARKRAGSCGLRGLTGVSHLGRFWPTVTAMVGKGAGAQTSCCLAGWTMRPRQCRSRSYADVVLQIS
jgi:hypothetical protein